MEIENIQWEPTTPYNPHQNRVKKRCFRTLFETTRAILYDVGLPNDQWGEAISTADYLKNKSYTKSLKEITKYEADIGHKPDLGNFHRFGCIDHRHDKNPQRKKLSNQGIKCQFLGYKNRNQYRIWDRLRRKVIQSSHVI